MSSLFFRKRNSAQSEKRSFKRIPFVFDVDYTSNNFDRNKGKGINLSKGGLLLGTGLRFTYGQELKFFIKVPAFQDPITLMGAVVRSRESDKYGGYETAVNFKNFSGPKNPNLEKIIHLYS